MKKYLGVALLLFAARVEAQTIILQTTLSIGVGTTETAITIPVQPATPPTTASIPSYAGGTSYSVGNVIYDPATGYVYKALVAHVGASIFSGDSPQTNWSYVGAVGSVTTWTPKRFYVTGQFTIHLNQLIQRIVAGISTAQYDGTEAQYWTVIGTIPGASAGLMVYVDNEAMPVSSVGASNNGQTLTLTRAALGTSAAVHAAGALVYVGQASQFLTADQSGACTVGTAQIINVLNQTIFSCPAGTWVGAPTKPGTGGTPPTTSEPINAPGGAFSTYSYVQGAAGSVGRTQTSKNQDVVSLMDFAANGNGSFDNTTALTAAAASGKSILIPAGIFNFSGPVTFGAVAVLGMGKSTTLQHTSITGNGIIFDFAGSTNPIHQNIGLFNLNLKGPFLTGTPTTAETCLLIGNGGGGASGLTVDHVDFERCGIAHTFGNDVFGITVSNSTFNANVRHLVWPAGLLDAGENMNWINDSFQDGGAADFSNCIVIDGSIGAAKFAFGFFDDCGIVVSGLNSMVVLDSNHFDDPGAGNSGYDRLQVTGGGHVRIQNPDVYYTAGTANRVFTVSNGTIIMDGLSASAGVTVPTVLAVTGTGNAVISNTMYAFSFSNVVTNTGTGYVQNQVVDATHIGAFPGILKNANVFLFGAGNLTNTAANTIAIGSGTMTALTSGFNNTSVGVNSLPATTGANDTAIGVAALGGNTTGAANFGGGASACVTNSSGSNNTCVGASADVATGALTHATAIGSGATVSTSNTLVLGRPADSVLVPGVLNASGSVVEALSQKFTCTHGTNGTCGVITLTAGAATISTTAIAALAASGAAGDVVHLECANNPATTTTTACASQPFVSAISTGTSFAIGGTGTDTVYWEIRHIN